MAMSMEKKEAIRTSRLILKPYDLEDVQALTELLTNPKITKYFMVPEFESREQAEQLAKKIIALSWQEDAGRLEYGIYADGKLIGFVNDCGIEAEKIEIGYVIHPDYQGRGYATEAVRAVIGALREMGFKKVSAGFFEENEASHRVMEKCRMHLTDRVAQEAYRGVYHTCRYCEIDL